MDTKLSTIELSSFIGEIYDAAITAQWSEVLDKLIEMTGSNKALIMQDFTQEKPPILALNSDVEYSHLALTHYQQRLNEDPFYLSTKDEPAGKCINCNNYVDINLHIGSDYYQNVLKPMKTHFVLVAMLSKDGVNDSVFILNRGEEQAPYTTAEESLVNMLVPHLSRAMHIYKELRLYKNYSSISKSILDQEDKAIVVCDQQGGILLSNQYANDKLLAPCIVALNGQSIAINNAVYQQQLNDFIEQCASLAYKEIGTQETLLLEGEGAADNILITVSPLSNRNQLNDIDVPCCMVTVTFQQQLNWQILQSEFSLTPKELQLLKAIYAKKKLHQLTQEFSVSYNTLRTHLQSIFRKIGVNSQTELMVKVSLFK